MFTRSLSIVLGVWLVPLMGQAPDPQLTGLRPPTVEEQTWMDANLILVEQVLPNRLALQRVEAEQSKTRTALNEGALALPSQAFAEDGVEIQGHTRTGARSIVPALNGTSLSITQTAAASMAYPSSVDNSAELWFPPISSQGSLGSCASFSTTYYTMTSQVARLRGWDLTNDVAGAKKFSTRFIYNQINNGSDSGSWITTAYNIMLKSGCATLQDWPYTTDYLAWPTSTQTWRTALNYRMDTSGTIESVNTAAGLANMKQMLANGYLLNYATNIYQWQFANLSNDPSTTADDWIFAAGIPAARRRICTHVINSNSGHGMTIVGYDDNLWVDLNGNGVVDAGEKGAFRIANSWGNGWQDGGFTWISYDALNPTSAVSGGPNPTGREAAFWYEEAYWISARPTYSPALTAEITLSTAKRNQVSVSLGRGATSATMPSTTWYPSVLRNMGGSFAFDGSSVALPVTFVLDCTDLINSTSAGQRWFASVSDSSSGYPVSVSNLQFVDSSSVTTPCSGTNPAGGLPITVDASTLYAFADNAYITGLAPTILTQPLSTAVYAGRTATFSVLASGSGTLTYQWKKNGTAISGATSAIYTTPVVGTVDNGETFTVVVSNGSGQAASNAALLTVNQKLGAPTITGQPQDVAVPGRSAATFGVTASGSGLTYQWWKNGIAIPRATSATYTLPITTTADHGATFHVVVKNTAGWDTSRDATLSVQIRPSIVSQPQGQTVTAPAKATFSLTATGSPSPAFQWQVSTNGTTWTNVASGTGSTTATYTTAVTTIQDNGSKFRCVLTGAGSPVISNSVTLIVKAAPAITTQPLGLIEVVAPAAASFRVVATGNPAVTHQWQVSTNGGPTWTNIVGATSATYTTGATTLSQNGRLYRVILTNSLGTITSASAELAVHTRPAVLTQPKNQTVTAPATATFTIAASGSPSPICQWQFSTNGITWANVSNGSGNPTYTTGATTIQDNGTKYRCVLVGAGAPVNSVPVTLTVKDAPAITTQPSGLIDVVAPAAASFHVVATGNPAVTHQWQVSTNGGSSWTSIIGATSSTYTTGATTLSQDGRLYRVILTNSLGTITSATAELAVHTRPAVLTQPKNQTVTAPAPATFTIAASGSPSPIYQWEFSTNGITWANVSTGSGNPTYTTGATTIQDNGTKYRCVLVGAGAPVNSLPVTLTVKDAPAITAQPSDCTVVAPATASFHISATGNPAVTHQWQVFSTSQSKWINIAGAIGATYTTGATALAQSGGQYRVILTNSLGTVTSNAATLTVHTRPAVVIQPKNQTVTAPAAASFTITASGSPSPTYQWQFSTNGITWMNVSTGLGGTTASYTTDVTTIQNNSTKFRCVLAGAGAPVNSLPATLTVKDAPAITTQPVDCTVVIPATASFHVSATGNPAVTRQWQVSTNGGSTWTSIVGATGASYTTGATALSQSGRQYRVILTNSLGNATSNVVILTVQ